MLDFNSVLIGSAQPKVLAAFYEKLLGKPADWSEGGFYGWQVGSASLVVGEHSEVKGKAKEPQRVMLNLASKEVKTEFERIKNSGAKVIKELYQFDKAWIATFADPDGNYFQVMSPLELISRK